MNMKLKALLGCLFIFVLVTHATAKVNLTRLVRKIQPGVVIVITYDKKMVVKGQGSGFFINKKGHLITNYHVLKGAHMAKVKTYDGFIFPITHIIAENKTMDLIKVLVGIPSTVVRHIEVTKKFPEIAESVIIVGNPMGLEQSISDGIVSGIRVISPNEKFIQITAPISQGSSGSPVINMKGQVIGVATFYLAKGKNLNFAAPGIYVFELMHESSPKTIKEWSYSIRSELAEELIEKASILMGRGEYSKAIPILEESIERYEKDVAAWVYLGTCNSELNNPKDAIDAFRTAIRIMEEMGSSYRSFPGSARMMTMTYVSLASNYIKIRDLNGCVNSSSKAIDLYLNGDLDINEQQNRQLLIKAYIHRALGNSALNDNQSAMNDYERVINLDPTNSTAHMQLGELNFQNKNYPRALTHIDRAIDFDPTNGDAYSLRGRVYFLRKDYVEAISDFNKAIKFNTTDSDVGLLRNLAYKFIDVGKNRTYDSGGYKRENRTYDSGGYKKDQPCFIATAVFGSSTEPEVRILREFRNRFLLPYSIGKKFIALYYEYSPPIAASIANYSYLKTIIRWSLLPIVGISYVVLYLGPTVCFALIIVLIALGCFYIAVSNKRRKLKMPHPG